MNQNAGPELQHCAPPGSDGTRAAAAKIRFEPQSLTLKAGQTATIGVVVENVTDLFSIPLLLQYNPAVISVKKCGMADSSPGERRKSP